MRKRNQSRDRDLENRQIADWCRRNTVCPAGCDPQPFAQGRELLCWECWFVNGERSVMRAG